MSAAQQPRWAAVAAAAAFGAVDGIGLSLGLLLVLGRHGLLLAALANGASEFAGMSAGQYLSTRGECDRLTCAVANGVCGLIGVIVPVVLFVSTGVVGATVAIVVLMLVLGAIAPSEPWWRSYVEAGAVVVFVLAADVIVKVATS